MDHRNTDEMNKNSDVAEVQTYSKGSTSRVNWIKLSQS